MGHVNTKFEEEFEESYPIIEGIKQELDFYNLHIRPMFIAKQLSPEIGLLYFKLSKMDQALLDIAEVMEIKKEEN
jgi:hypothetical protein